MPLLNTVIGKKIFDIGEISPETGINKLLGWNGKARAKHISAFASAPPNPPV